MTYKLKRDDMKIELTEKEMSDIAYQFDVECFKKEVFNKCKDRYTDEEVTDIALRAKEILDDDKFSEFDKLGLIFDAIDELKSEGTLK